MAFIPVVNTVMVEIRYTFLGQHIENTLYFKFITAVDIVDMEGLAADIDAWVQAALMPNLSVDLLYTGLKLTLLQTSTSPVYELTATPAVAGGDTAATLPGSNTFCVQFKTLERGRSFRGRNYIPGVSQATLATANTFLSAFADAIVNVYEELLDPDTFTSDWTWVVVSRQADGVPRETGLTTNVYSVGYADLNMDSQRRRLPGRGS